MKNFVIIPLLAVLIFTIIGCSDEKIEENNNTKIIQSAPVDMLNRLKAGEIDGFIAWEPFNSEAVQQDIGRYLVQSGDIWDQHPCCVLAVSKDFQNENVLTAVVWAHIKATQFINNPNNLESIFEHAAAFTGKDRKIVEKALENIEYVEYPQTEGFITYYTKLQENGLLVQEHQDIGYSGGDSFFEDFLRKDIYNLVLTEMSKDDNWRPLVDETTKITIGFLARDLHQLAFFVAQKEKYFEEVGLKIGDNIEIREYANGVAVMEAFRAKEIDFAYLGGAPAMLKRVNDDIHIQVIAGANNEGSAIVVGKDSGISNINDLGGKTIAIPGIGTVQHFVVDSALREAGIMPVLE
ncbi:MAG: hypothetical protein APF76_15055 [Desulfitibacter sp. BRH_c19]|nr:MAG: hypothetical protein APF76_15055 [Desulfitibacter sp. BRH_c19]